MQGSDKQDFQALHAPVTPKTWSITAELARTVESTGGIPVRFTRPIEILGIKATVTAKRPLTGGGLIIPTVDDLDVSLITDDEDLWTKHLKESGSEGQFVALSHLTVDAPRLLRIVPRGSAPDLSFEFAWGQFIDAAHPIFEDALIRLSLFCRYITAEERDAWLRGDVKDGSKP
jgi:hypothetical protein